jgi:PIN domain nuclease of toxin-antitoxin system
VSEPDRLSTTARAAMDRMLAAQAMRVGATPVTRDDAFAELLGLELLW